MQYDLDTILGQFQSKKFVGRMGLGTFPRNPTHTYVLNLMTVGQ
jgi:hypothetical protein